MSRIEVAPVVEAAPLQVEVAVPPRLSHDSSTGAGRSPGKPKLAQISRFSNRGTFQLAEAGCIPSQSKKPAPGATSAKPVVEEPAVEEPAVEERAVEEPAVEEPAADSHRSNPFVDVLTALGSTLKKLLQTPTAPGEVRDIGQAVSLAEQGVAEEGVAILLPLKALDHTKLQIKANIVVWNPDANTRLLLGNKQPWTLKQLLDESKRRNRELHWTTNSDGDQIIIEGDDGSARHAPVPGQTVHVHTHPYVPRNTFDPEVGSPHPIIVFSDLDLKTYRQLRGTARFVLTDEGEVLLYLDTTSHVSGKDALSPFAPCSSESEAS